MACRFKQHPQLLVGLACLNTIIKTMQWLTGLFASRILLGQGNFDPWVVNVDGEYHEEIVDN